MITTYQCRGTSAFRVNVTAGPHSGFSVIGRVPDANIREMQVRVKSAIINSGLSPFKGGEALVDSPYEVKGSIDLAVALALLDLKPTNTAVIGELGLDGCIRSVAGALPCALQAKEDGCKTIVVPKGNAQECLLVPGITVLVAKTLADFFPEGDLEGARRDATPTETNPLDLSDVKGNEHAKRAMEVAAAGGHSILLVGPPGAGKTMLARRLPTIMPEMSGTEMLDTGIVYSAAGLFCDTNRMSKRPFRAPHHTISDMALTGGGTGTHPGEMSLAHNGVLFLDEMPEFQRSTISHLKPAMEEGQVTIGHGEVKMPANFLLVGAMSPCACGHFGDPRKVCLCTVPAIERYKARTESLPFQMMVEVPTIPVEKLRSGGSSEVSATVRARVEAARKIQGKRFNGTNAQMSPKDMETYCKLDAEGTRFLEACSNRLGLSTEAVHNCIKIARTIADLDGMEAIRVEHLAEAIQYRRS